jgi:probable F420-dependent oxidoreductase
MKTATLGVWSLANFMSAADSAAFAQRVEQWSYSTLWVPEVMARDPMVTCSWLLAHTSRLNVATGIASIYAREPFAMQNARYALAEQSAGRFLLGLGVSHAPFVEGAMGLKYGKPVATMRDYLERMNACQYLGPPPAEEPKTVLGAQGPRMLELAAAETDGAHPYNVTPDHTALAREILGRDKLLCPEQKVVLEIDPDIARGIARKALAMAVTLRNYRNSFLRQGFATEDLENGGSDKLIDSIVVWGDEQAIRDRIQQHWDAGADQVCIQPLRRDPSKHSPDDEKILELLAPAND